MTSRKVQACRKVQAWLKQRRVGALALGEEVERRFDSRMYRDLLQRLQPKSSRLVRNRMSRRLKLAMKDPAVFCNPLTHPPKLFLRRR